MNHFLIAFPIFLLLLDLRGNQLFRFITRINETALKDNMRKLSMNPLSLCARNKGQLRKLEVSLTR